MKKVDFGQAISVFANVGVIAGIFFLVLELRQNNELLEAQTSFSQLDLELARRSRYIDDPELLELVLRDEAGELLTNVEAGRLELLNNNILDIYRWQFREHEAGRLPDDYLDLRTWRDVWRYQRKLVDLFEEDRQRLDPAFVQFIEQNVLNDSE